MSKKSDSVWLKWVGTILFFFFIWALLFGLNVNGKHYGITCGGHGVDVSTGK